MFKNLKERVKNLFSNFIGSGTSTRSIMPQTFEGQTPDAAALNTNALFRMVERAGLIRNPERKTEALHNAWREVLQSHKNDAVNSKVAAMRMQEILTAIPLEWKPAMALELMKFVVESNETKFDMPIETAIVYMERAARSLPETDRTSGQVADFLNQWVLRTTAEKNLSGNPRTASMASNLLKQTLAAGSTIETPQLSAAWRKKDGEPIRLKTAFRETVDATKALVVTGTMFGGNSEQVENYTAPALAAA